MAYITRDDGVHFVIPSYRDVLSAKQKSLLKKEILLLSQNYGEYITLQRKNANQYEVAFSAETGYLLGESIWQQFNRPSDMIFCEAIPNTTDAILVIVKSGSVYLDGSFPVDSIPEELVIFLTQQNNFEIYTYGDVPITQLPEEGKFSFEANSVKSFTILDKPIFPTLPLLKIYQLQLVNTVLKAHGIGVFPVKELIGLIAVVGVIYLIYSYMTAPAVEVVQQVVMPSAAPVNPYQGYNDELTSPAPDVEIKQFLDNLKVFLSMPGWAPTEINYSKGVITAPIKSQGGQAEALYFWAQSSGVSLNIKRDGVFVSMNLNVPKRSIPVKIYPIDQLLTKLVDNIAAIYPGNTLSISDFSRKGFYTSVKLNIALTNISPLFLNLLGEQFKGLPIVLEGIKLVLGDNSGTITIEILGS